MNGGVYHPHCAQDAMYPKFTEARVREIVREEIAAAETERKQKNAAFVAEINKP
jgi:hypothetical protein